jgi:tRNA (guanine37-N1)-methyltransferase
MRIDIYSVFPEYLDGALSASLLGKARAGGLLDVRIHDPRDWSTDAHRSVDDAPFGGGAGMVMTPEPLFAAVEATDPVRPLFVLSPSGQRFDQEVATSLADSRLEIASIDIRILFKNSQSPRRYCARCH